MPIQIPSPTPTTQVVYEVGRLVVMTKPTWGDSWQYVDYLTPKSISRAASPGVSHVTFLWQAGKIKHEDAGVFRNEPPRDFNGSFVKVEYHNPGTARPNQTQSPDAQPRPAILFVGRILHDDSTIFAGSDDGVYPTDQQITAYGLETELDRVVINTSWVKNGAAPFEIDHVITCNDRPGPGLSNIGNRSADKMAVDGYFAIDRMAYAFTGRQATGNTSKLWNAYAVVNYALMRFAPHWMPLEMGAPVAGGQTVWNALEEVELQGFKMDGRTVKSVLDELIKSQRGMGWFLDYSENADGVAKLSLNVFTMVGEDVSVDGSTLPANKPPIQLPAYSVLNRDVSISIDDLARYGKIRIVGQRMRSAFTVSFTDGTLEKVWTPAEETAYKNVPGATSADKDNARKAIKFTNVFRSYRVPQAWGWKAGDGEGGAKHLVNPKINEADGKCDYEHASEGPARNWGHSFDRSLPIKDLTENESVEPNYIASFAAVKATSGSGGSGPEKWNFAHDTNDNRSSCHISLSDGEMGVTLEMSPNHLMAKNVWTDSEGKTAKTPFFDYRKVAATVCVKTDQRLKVVITIPDADPFREKTIYVPDAEAWLVVPGTAVDIAADGTLVKWSPTIWGKYVPREEQERVLFPFVRYDDRRLRQVAAMAKAFYGERRSVLRWGVSAIDTSLRLGQYVSDLLQQAPADSFDSGSGYPVGTVITSMTYDCIAMTTSLVTNFAELDVTVRNRGGRSSGE